ncbi:MAG TPA: copper chaperone PCu(A)C, partial [Steroidobacteraceae bacterium]
MIVQSVFPLARRGLAAAPLGAGLLRAGVLAAALFMTAGAAPAFSQAPASRSPATDTTRGASASQVRIENAWIPQPPPGAEVAAAYFTLHNAGREPAVLVGVDCPLAAAAMLHESSVVAGESRMRMIERLTIPAEQSVTLKPGGLHVMLHEISSPLA